jgi:hypothetical protein
MFSMVAPGVTCTATTLRDNKQTTRHKGMEMENIVALVLVMLK